MKHDDGLDAWLTALRHEMARACKLPEKVKAKAEYIRRRAVGENINLKEFAGEMGANYESLRRWKIKDGWEKDELQRGPRCAERVLAHLRDAEKLVCGQVLPADLRDVA